MSNNCDELPWFLEDDRARDPLDVPGPIDWEHASHWIAYDHENKTVETWCKMGPGYRFRLRTRCRPMSRMELIHSLLRDYSREEILKAYGVVEKPIPQSSPPKRKWWLFWRK